MYMFVLLYNTSIGQMRSYCKRFIALVLWYQQKSGRPIAGPPGKGGGIKTHRSISIGVELVSPSHRHAYWLKDVFDDDRIFMMLEHLRKSFVAMGRFVNPRAP